MAGRGLDWRSVTPEDVAGFVGWLRLPPQARDGKVAVLPTADHHCAGSSVNRKLAALSSFCEFHARNGAPLGDLMVTMRPAGRRGHGSSYKPFLEHIAKSRPQKSRTIRLRQPRRRPVVLSAGDAQAVLDGCEHLRDRRLPLRAVTAAGGHVGERDVQRRQSFTADGVGQRGHRALTVLGKLPVRRVARPCGATPAAARRIPRPDLRGHRPAAPDGPIRSLFESVSPWCRDHAITTAVLFLFCPAIVQTLA
ncbi:hypothetical protein [Streptomyces sp. NBC_00079]|uniref:hypothetical protein n=1 Tax=Streptomyces sp. NBC_00079 TaxID=2975644 RepID=UPI003254F943